MAEHKKCESPNRFELRRPQNNIDFFSLSKTHNLKTRDCFTPIYIYNIKIHTASINNMITSLASINNIPNASSNVIHEFEKQKLESLTCRCST